MNWVWLPDGSVKVQNVGVVKKSASGDEELILDGDKIFWSFESTKVTLASTMSHDGSPVVPTVLLMFMMFCPNVIDVPMFCP